MSATDRRRSSSTSLMPCRRISLVTFACSTASAVGTQAYSFITSSKSRSLLVFHSPPDPAHRRAAVDAENLAGDEAGGAGVELCSGGFCCQRGGRACVVGSSKPPP